ncbi:MAG: chromosome segregation ATPase [Myxococcota bacterium]|jgi:chromosome segregation ATPase
MSDDRLEQIQSELAGILEERLGALDRVLQKTESSTRRIISANVEAERHQARIQRLDSERVIVEEEVTQVRTRADEVHSQHAGLIQARDRTRAEVHRLEQEIRESDAEVERNRQRIVSLEAEANTLREENNAQRTKVKTLEENIMRMQRLKAELMSSVTGLAQQLRQTSE